MPYKDTIMSKDHKIVFNEQLVPAERFLDCPKAVKKVRYNGEVLYNVLLDSHSCMNVNGLICETLHPANIIAKLYDYIDEEKNMIISQMNESLEKRDLLKYKSIVKRLV